MHECEGKGGGGGKETINRRYQPVTRSSVVAVIEQFIIVMNELIGYDYILL
jgi:hypothetical protein